MSAPLYSHIWPPWSDENIDSSCASPHFLFPYAASLLVIGTQLRSPRTPFPDSPYHLKHLPKEAQIL